MYLMMMVSFLLSATLILLTHPVTITALILLQTMTLCLLMWMKNQSAWFSYILFLIFLGGLMVLFIYMTSLASNEKFSMEIKTSSSATVMIITIMVIIFMESNFTYQEINMKLNTPQSISLMFSNQPYLLILIIMSYLFLTLIVAVKISTQYEGPMRSIIKK